jgi:hypothetical protein
MASVQALLIRAPEETGGNSTAAMTRYGNKVICSKCPQAYFLDYQAQSLNGIPDGLNKVIVAAQTVAGRQHNANHQMSTVPVNQI